MPTRRSRTCCSGWSNSTGSPFLRPTCVATWTRPSPGDCISSFTSRTRMFPPGANCGGTIWPTWLDWTLTTRSCWTSSPCRWTWPAAISAISSRRRLRRCCRSRNRTTARRGDAAHPRCSCQRARQAGSPGAASRCGRGLNRCADRPGKGARCSTSRRRPWRFRPDRRLGCAWPWTESTGPRAPSPRLSHEVEGKVASSDSPVPHVSAIARPPLVVVERPSRPLAVIACFQPFPYRPFG